MNYLASPEPMSHGGAESGRPIESRALTHTFPGWSPSTQLSRTSSHRIRFSALMFGWSSASPSAACPSRGHADPKQAAPRLLQHLSEDLLEHLDDGLAPGQVGVGGVADRPRFRLETAWQDLLVLHRQGPFLQFLAATQRAGAVCTLESLARIELGAQGGALVERVTTTRTAKDGTATTTVRERFTAPDWHADGWFLERRHPTDWSRRTELVLPEHDQAKEADPLVGVHDELRLARLSRQKRLGKSTDRSSTEVSLS